MEYLNYFVISQILVAIAMVFDFLSFQYKDRKKTFLCFMISASLISIHYFLLFKIAAWVIVFFSVLRFVTCYFTTNTKYFWLFIFLNTFSIFFTFNTIYDLLIYIWSIFIITGNFQKDNRNMRKMMMVWTLIVIIYNLIIFSPVAALMEWSFLLSNFIWYYRHYIKETKTLEQW
ncbi:MAG: hypothetical protein ACD_4C00262G0006 [uncultured bacterium (gcode 4)]|uniref:Uncharacterized protein n=1 Tax=uncultured bacterium (gcode 4) TaxID=1234023 RepID=K2GT15_9BACT|nr:MAG: hypothetical protein ACD_4C00262G0006 [uncultured bacterium (gcode 4)]